MALVHLFAVEVKCAGGKFAGATVPAIGEQNSTEVEKKSGDRHGGTSGR
jgi:hypothetical protein